MLSVQGKLTQRYTVGSPADGKPGGRAVSVRKPGGRAVSVYAQAPRPPTPRETKATAGNPKPHDVILREHRLPAATANTGGEKEEQLFTDTNRLAAAFKDITTDVRKMQQVVHSGMLISSSTRSQFVLM
ncbi:hypothetical protein EYF80_008575 [Liparis tanakae]|uniref:Uncharacterized protein n=1 Tax=Liparis tanakae TaxID=230148 RepID=A0A4Z2ITT8_9TELE|nr:hypothetical protein EYF80_008575 [Liparis tanakae]